MSSDLLTPAEAAAIFRVSSVSLCRYARAGRIPHFRVGKKIRFRLDDLLTHLYVKKKTRKPVVTRQNRNGRLLMNQAYTYIRKNAIPSNRGRGGQLSSPAAAPTLPQILSVRFRE